MERKIGEIFEHNGEWYQYVTDNMIEYCQGCTSFKNLRCTAIYAAHDCWLRAKCKKLKPVADPYPLYDHIVQRYAGVTKPVILPQEPFTIYNAINNTVDIEVKQDKENTEDMETNHKTMPIPEGWEFDRIDGDKVILKEKKKELPKTWHGCLRTVNETEYINDCSDIDTQTSIDEMERGGYLFGDCDRNLLPVGLAAPMLALCQLLVCRNAWWKQLGWKPDWTDRKTMKHCIHSDGFSTTDITRHSTFPRILAFPDAKTADDFRNTFKDLIEEAKELI